MAAAIVELDALTDAVGATAQDHDLLAVAGAGFVFHVAHRRGFVGRIHIGGLRLKLGGAGVDALEDRVQVMGAAGVAHGLFGEAGQGRQTGVGKAHHLELAQAVQILGQAAVAHGVFGVHNLAQARQEPRVKGGGVLDFVVAQAVAHGLCDQAQPVGGLGADRLDHGRFLGRAGDLNLIQPGQAILHRGKRFLQRFVEAAANRHHLAHGFHRRGQFGFRAREFLEGKARDLGHDIVDGRLERGRRHLGDVVVEFVQRVTHGQLRRDLGNGEAGGLRGQRRGPRDARVHLDHDHAAVFRVHRPLHVRAAGFDADLAQDGNRAVPHALIFAVGQGQRRGDGDRIAGMHAHRIDVLDGADDDRVVGAVAHHLEFIFLPAQQRFIDQHLRHRRGLQPRAHDAFVIVAVIGHAAAGAAQGEGGADDRGQADLFQIGHGLGDARGDVIFAIRQLRRGDNGRARVFQPDAVHRLAEQLAVLGHLDGGALSADQLDPVAVQHAGICQGQRGVQPGLPAHGRQKRVGAFLGDDLFDHLGGDRLDIGGIGHFRVGHDRRRVRVYQNDPVTLFAQRLAGLSARVVEFAGLPDDDGTGADDQDGFNIGSFRHDGPSGLRQINRPGL